MPVLLNEYKKIQYLVDSLVLPFIKNNHPKWRELILTYLKFLDNNALFKSMKITDNVDINEMYTELLDDFLELYFKDVIDVDKFGLNDDNKRLFISLSKLIGNLKATKTSFGFFFNSFSDFSIPSDSGDIGITDMAIELKEMPEWWLLNNFPTRPYTYVFKIDTPEMSNLKELIKQVHPAGWLQLFLFETEFEDFMNGHDCFELDIHYGILYNGKWNYDGTMDILGTQYPTFYNGGYTFADDINCAPRPKSFASTSYMDYEVRSSFGSEWFSPVLMSDFGSIGNQGSIAIDKNYNLYNHNLTLGEVYKMDGITSRHLETIGYPEGYESWLFQSMTWNNTTNRLCVVMRDDKTNIHWIELVGFTTEIALDIHLEYIGSGVFTQDVTQLQYDAQRDLLVGIGTGYSGSYHNYIITYNYDGSLYEGGWHGKLLTYTNQLKYCILDVADRKIYVVDAYVDDNKLLEYDYLAYAGTGGASKLGEIQFNTRSIGEYGIALDPNGDMWMAGQMSSNPYDNLISRYIKISNTPNPGVPLSFASKAEPAYLNHPEVPGIVTDITDPAIDVRGAPGELIFIDQDNQAGDFEGVTAHGDFIYAAGGAYGLRSFSVDVAGVLTHIDVDDQGGDYKSVWAGVTGAGPILVFATDSWSFGSGLMTYSVDGSGNLTFLDNDHQGTDGYRGVWGDGTFIYAACKDNGLRSYSVDGAGLLTYIDTDYQAGDDGDYVDVWGDGNFIYVASDLMGLRTYSVDGAGILTHIDTDMQGSGGYMGVWGDGNFIYVATYNQGLRSYSVDGAGNLTYIDTTYQSGLYYSVWGDGTFIYAACRFDGIRSFSVDESGHFTYIDTDKQGSAGYLDVWGDGIFIYAACDFEGLRSYGVTREKGNFASTANIVSDITDPAITVGNFEFLDQDNQGTAAYLDVWGDGNFIYTACHLEGLRSYSVNESGILTHIDSNVAYPGDSYSAVWCDANFIYAATGDYLISYSVDGSGYLTVEDSVTALFTGYKDVCGDGSFIFTANMGTTYGLRSHTVDGAGEITFKNNLQAGAGIGIWCDGNFIYVVGTNGIRSFTVDGNGDLTHKDSDNQGGGVYRSVWGDGNFIYVICDDGVRTYSVDGIGNLTHIVFNLDGAGSGSEKGIWGDGNLIYIGTGSNGIRSFTVDGAGNLTLLDSDDSYGNNYRGVWGDGTFIYACADGLISYKII